MFSRDLIKDKISLLGFGAMRLPTNDNEIDMEQFKTMVDYAIDNGVNYFDTAYIYHNEKSEGAVKEALVERYDRDKFFIADKIPVWMANSSDDYEKLFNTMLNRLGVEYIDFLLLHSLSSSSIENVEKFKGFEYALQKKKEGRAKYIGFSFHDNYETFKYILDKYHHILDFVQLQINYLDWKIIESDKCYELAKHYNVPVIVMEPVKGGTLANFPDTVNELFKEADNTKSPASWAIRFGGTLDNVMCILSGMSNLDQMKDNVKTTTNFTPFTKSDYELIDKVLSENRKYATIGCTSCDYCHDCPVNINISGVFTLYNELKTSKNNAWNSQMMYRQSVPVHADTCIECGKCEKICPQNLEIIKLLKTSHKALLPS